MDTAEAAKKISAEADPSQAAILPGGVTERIFDGSFNNNQLDPIDSGSGFMTRGDYVYEDTAFAIPIDFNGGAVDGRTGGLTGTDTVGGLWFGKLKIGKTGFLRSGTVTFGTRSDDGSVFWIDQLDPSKMVGFHLATPSFPLIESSPLESPGHRCLASRRR